jgi:hypothetical protein
MDNSSLTTDTSDLTNEYLKKDYEIRREQIIQNLRARYNEYIELPQRKDNPIKAYYTEEILRARRHLNIKPFEEDLDEASKNVASKMVCLKNCLQKLEDQTIPRGNFFTRSKETAIITAIDDAIKELNNEDKPMDFTKTKSITQQNVDDLIVNLKLFRDNLKNSNVRSRYGFNKVPKVTGYRGCLYLLNINLERMENAQKDYFYSRKENDPVNHTDKAPEPRSESPPMTMIASPENIYSRFRRIIGLHRKENESKTAPTEDPSPKNLFKV